MCLDVNLPTAYISVFGWMMRPSQRPVKLELDLYGKLGCKETVTDSEMSFTRLQSNRTLVSFSQVQLKCQEIEYVKYIEYIAFKKLLLNTKSLYHSCNCVLEGL